MRKRTIDLIGQKIGPFNVLAIDNKKSNRSYNYWVCECSLCNSKKSYRTDMLRKHKLTSCGCSSLKVKIGDRFGKLVVKNRISTISRSVYWICKCDCGNEIKVSSSSLKLGKKACGCLKNAHGENHQSFKGYKQISGSFIKRIYNQSKNRGIKFNITIEQIWQIYEQQKRICALSGEPIVFGTYIKKTRKYTECTASLDRIDSNKDYETNNIQWVHKKINIMKNNFSQEEFISMCKKVTDYNSKACGSSKCG